MNRVTLIGRLGADPETRESNATKVVRIKVATDESFKNKEGERVSRTEWHRVTFFGNTAAAVAQRFSKGDPICVEGKLSTTSYEKDGVTHYVTDILGTGFEFLPKAKTVESEPIAQRVETQVESDDDLPF